MAGLYDYPPIFIKAESPFQECKPRRQLHNLRLFGVYNNPSLPELFLQNTQAKSQVLLTAVYQHGIIHIPGMVADMKLLLYEVVYLVWKPNRQNLRYLAPDAQGFFQSVLTVFAKRANQLSR